MHDAFSVLNVRVDRALLAIATPNFSLFSPYCRVETGCKFTPLKDRRFLHL